MFIDVTENEAFQDLLNDTIGFRLIPIIIRLKVVRMIYRGPTC